MIAAFAAAREAALEFGANPIVLAANLLDLGSLMEFLMMGTRGRDRGGAHSAQTAVIPRSAGPYAARPV